MVDSVAGGSRAGDPGPDVRKDELMQARPFLSSSSLFSPSYLHYSIHILYMYALACLLVSRSDCSSSMSTFYMRNRQPWSRIQQTLGRGKIRVRFTTMNATSGTKRSPLPTDLLSPSSPCLSESRHLGGTMATSGHFSA